MFDRLLFNLYTFFIGFKFYVIDIKLTPENDPTIFNTVTADFTRGKPMMFNFHRKEMEFNVYRFGKIQTEKRFRYGVSTYFDDENHSDFVVKYNKKMVSFYIPWIFLLTDESICRFLLDLSLTYMIDQMEKHGQMRRLNVTPDTGQRRRASDRDPANRSSEAPPAQ